jgi:hypothetical protein
MRISQARRERETANTASHLLCSLFFCLKDRDGIFLRNVGSFSANYMAIYPEDRTLLSTELAIPSPWYVSYTGKTRKPFRVSARKSHLMRQNLRCMDKWHCTVT